MTSINQDQSFLNIKGQVAKVLLEYARNSNNGHNRLSQRDIATMLGTGWDTVHLSLKSLYNEGIIRIERNRIVVNKELIQKVAGAV
ncbi:MAG: helix-turn-helix domain-containing protein [Dehalococcoidales bacterium]